MFDFICKNAYDGILAVWCRWNDRVKENPDNEYMKAHERELDQSLKQMVAFMEMEEEDKAIIENILRRYQF